jgi:hypothetical protein
MTSTVFLELLSALKQIELEDDAMIADLEYSCCVLNMKYKKPIVEDAPIEVKQFLCWLQDGQINTTAHDWGKTEKYKGVFKIYNIVYFILYPLMIIVVNMYNVGKAISGKNQIQPALDYLGITGKGNITNKANQIITHLASSEDVVEPDTVALRCLKKWFMKPLQGTRIQGMFRKVM